MTQNGLPNNRPQDGRRGDATTPAANAANPLRDDKPPIPCIAGPYQNVYRPLPDVFQGPDSAHYVANRRYEEWVPNDFTIVHDGARWHLFGITHPKPEGYEGGAFDPKTIHEAEWQLFHAVSEEGSPLRELMRGGSFAQCPQVLSAVDRPAEQHEIWAPVVWKSGGGYRMLYSPNPFRYAESGDLWHWTPKGVAFREETIASQRDPYVFVSGGATYVVYLGERGLYIREFDEGGEFDKSGDAGDTVDAVNSSDSGDANDAARLLRFGPPTLLRASEAAAGVYMESPVIFQRHGFYYLLFCEYDPIRDARNAYASVTKVVAGETLESLAHADVLTTLPAHAPEIAIDADGAFYLASVEFPYRGVNLARLDWR